VFLSYGKVSKSFTKIEAIGTYPKSGFSPQGNNGTLGVKEVF